MKGWILATVSPVLVLVVAPAAFAQSQTTVHQLGDANGADTDQTGALVPAFAEIVQINSNNRVTVRQSNNGRSGNLQGDTIVVSQAGGDTAFVGQATPVNQLGSVAHVRQGPNLGAPGSDRLYLQQIGGDHWAEVAQEGSGNLLDLMQRIDANWQSSATHDGSIAEIHQGGEGGHSLVMDQYGMHSMGYVRQTGAQNSATIQQGFQYSTTNLDQSGSGNQAFISNYWHGDMTVTQRGTDGLADVQGGNVRVLQTETSSGAIARVDASRGPWTSTSIEQHGAGVAIASNEFESAGVGIYQQEASTARVQQTSFLGSVQVDQFAGSSGATADVYQGTRGGSLTLQQFDAAHATLDQRGVGGFAFVSQGAGTYGSLVATNQSGFDNALTLLQRRSATTSTSGPVEFVADIEQVGWANSALALQQGSRGHFTQISQIGDVNEVSSWQGGGSYHELHVLQLAGDNYAQVAQGGQPDASPTPLDPVAAEYSTSHNSFLSLIQSNVFNTAILTQMGSFDSIIGVQSGPGNYATVVQEAGGHNNEVGFTQSGVGNILDVSQSGSFNAANVNQAGLRDRAQILQVGSANSVIVNQ